MSSGHESTMSGNFILKFVYSIITEQIPGITNYQVHILIDSFTGEMQCILFLRRYKKRNES